MFDYVAALVASCKSDSSVQEFKFPGRSSNSKPLSFFRFSASTRSSDDSYTCSQPLWLRKLSMYAFGHTSTPQLNKVGRRVLSVKENDDYINPIPFLFLSYIFKSNINSPRSLPVPSSPRSPRAKSWPSSRRGFLGTKSSHGADHGDHHQRDLAGLAPKALKTEGTEGIGLWKMAKKRAYLSDQGRIVDKTSTVAWWFPKGFQKTDGFWATSPEPTSLANSAEGAARSFGEPAPCGGTCRSRGDCGGPRMPKNQLFFKSQSCRTWAFFWRNCFLTFFLHMFFLNFHDVSVSTYQGLPVFFITRFNHF